tara:strand:- start:547 stop:2349 length:1803 start_codon:yes stop_codon:yes gene_type:complete
LKSLAEERAMLQRRAKLKLELEARREVNRTIKQKQKDRMSTMYYRDCDGNLRRGKLSALTRTNISAVNTANVKYSTGPAKQNPRGTAEMRRIRRRLAREKLIHKRRSDQDARHKAQAEEARKREFQAIQNRQLVAKMMTESGFENVLAHSADDNNDGASQHGFPHASFSGYAYSRTVLSHALSHPIFHGSVRAPISTSRSQSGLSVRSMVSNLSQPALNVTGHNWRVFHSPPLCRGLARQHFRTLTAAHDRSEIIHPAIWGCVLASGLAFSDASVTCPALVGYSLERQIPRPEVSTRHLDKLRPPIRRLPRGGGCIDPLSGTIGGFDDAITPCHTCLGGRFGCPFCYELPEGLQLHKYSYMPGDTAQERMEHTPQKLHTDLTTQTALTHDRNVRHDRAEVLIKSIPCGTVIKINLFCDDSVRHLHHLFRAASTHGTEPLALLYLPTQHGLIEMDVDAEPLRFIDGSSRLPNRGSIPLFRYGLNKRDAKAVIFHGSHESAWPLVNIFIGNNLLMKHFPSASCLLSDLDSAPRTLPGTDLVQTGLWKVFSLQIFQHRLYAQQDDEAEESHRRHLEDRSLEKHVADALSHRRLEPASRRRRGR